MKRLLLPALVLAATTVFAADTNTLTVQATVLGTCKFSTGNSTLNFGNMDPSSGSATSASTTTQFWCTKGVGGETVTADTGLHFAGTNRNLLGPNNDVIPYSLTLNKDGSANAGP
ncbi:MAG TPA: spore coat protein U domain-containing protein, partial [Geobacterales bacterium]|nr:spore coat protein U domain-containing protein [Geobacterales bacterium]